MKTFIYTKNSLLDLILGILLVILSFSGLFLGSKLILKLIMYIIPIILLVCSIKPYKMAIYFFNKNIKAFIACLLQAIIYTLGAIYVLFFPIESLNYIIIILGMFLVINSINNMILTNSKSISFLPFILGIICILFSNSIINTFYTLFLLVVLFWGISKITTYLYNKNRTKF